MHIETSIRKTIKSLNSQQHPIHPPSAFHYIMQHKPLFIKCSQCKWADVCAIVHLKLTQKDLLGIGSESPRTTMYNIVL